MKTSLTVIAAAAAAAVIAGLPSRAEQANLTAHGDNSTGWNATESKNSCVSFLFGTPSEWDEVNCIAVPESELGPLKGVWNGTLNEGSTLRLPNRTSSYTNISVKFNSTADYW